VHRGLVGDASAQGWFGLRAVFLHHRLVARGVLRGSARVQNNILHPGSQIARLYIYIYI
jgi:hypothetical protein